MEEEAAIARHKLRFGRHEVTLPQSRPLRVGLGIAFLFGGIFAILPVLGLWMIPVGLFILSIDFPPIRRFRRRAVSWYGRWRRRRDAEPPSSGPGSPRKKKGPSG